MEAFNPSGVHLGVWYVVGVLLYVPPYGELVFPTPATTQVIFSPLICGATFIIYQVPIVIHGSGSKSSTLSHWPICLSLKMHQMDLGSAPVTAPLPSCALAAWGGTISGCTTYSLWTPRAMISWPIRPLWETWNWKASVWRWLTAEREGHFRGSCDEEGALWPSWTRGEHEGASGVGRDEGGKCSERGQDAVTD